MAVKARRLWQAFDRPNAMIKVPGTAAGLPAIRTLLAEGINVNVTLLFGLARYREVADSFLAGLEQRAGAGHSIERVASVASFFLSRIDTLVDARLDAIAGSGVRNLRGQADIASARLACAAFREWTASERWQRLAAYRDHGRSALRLEDDLDAARAVPSELSALGVDLEAISRQLEREGVRKFFAPFDKLHAMLSQRAAELSPKR